MQKQGRSRSQKGKTGRKSGAAVSASGPRHEPGTKDVKRRRRQIFIIVGVVVVVLLAIFVPLYYINYIAPFNRTIISVDGIKVSMGEFLDRARLEGSDPFTMLDTLTSELVIKIMAPQYGIEVADDDIDQQLRNLASDGTGDISDIEFEEWYRQQLNDNNMSDSQYREMLYMDLLTISLHLYLAERVPTVAEQVHLHIIAVSTYEEAQTAVARLEAGEDFATVAQEMSIDTSAEEGGDAGWVPPALLTFEGQVDALELNEVSAPMAYYSDTTSTEPDMYYIFMVSERDSARELSDDNLVMLQVMALDFWLDEEIPKHDIEYNFNSEIYAWLTWQLEKE
jgi:parvulin-like peptidyl-prolyl isomerase